MTSLTTGQTLPLSIEFDDATGAAMPPSVTDSPPVWTSGDPTIATVAAAADGLTALLTPVAVGGVVVTLVVLVAGVSFQASLTVAVNAVAPVLTSVKIIAGTPTP